MTRVKGRGNGISDLKLRFERGREVPRRELDVVMLIRFAEVMLRRAFTWLKKTFLGLLDELFGDPEKGDRNGAAVERMMD